MFKRKKAKQVEPVTIYRDPQLARIIAQNDAQWRLATQRIAVDIRKGYQKEKAS